MLVSFYETDIIHVDGSFYTRSEFGDGNLQYIPLYYACAGSESSLLSCSYYSYYNCYNSRTAGVKCYSKRIYSILRGRIKGAAYFVICHSITQLHLCTHAENINQL